MLYKVTNNSTSLKALASAAAGENHFVKPDTTVELDLKPLSHEQLKKYAAADLISELVDVDEDEDKDEDGAPLTKAQKAAAKKAAAAVAATVPAAPVVTEPVVPATTEPVVVTPETATTEPVVTPVPEPWQKGLEPPK